MKESKQLKILTLDPYLLPYEKDLELRLSLYKSKRSSLIKKKEKLTDFANAHHYFGFHFNNNKFIYREWAPGADEMYLTGDFNNWNTSSHKLTSLENGVFEIILDKENAPKPTQKVEAIIIKDNNMLRRVPLYATRVVQDKETLKFCAEIEENIPFKWTDSGFKPEKTPYIYECHIGMSGEEQKISSFNDFKNNVLPRIKELGYNTIQIMAILEHPYYGSFGYQVSNFFAVSSRYGKSIELKELINTAHKMGIAVLLDIVHSHAVKNVGEGLNLFDGTEYQFFHIGPKGEHPAWDTKLFNYGKNEVLHFLLSNLKYYMEEFHFDGFRFDGVTSMLYHDHGLGSAFTNYDMYFSMNTDTEAVTYLQLANELIHSINKNAITIAEDMSGMPGMCLPIKDGGIGFDYRLNMGVPDLWIKTLKESTDETLDIAKLWYELTNRRINEKSIGYSESHDQALVGDKTLMFRLCDAEMYYKMSKNSQSLIIDRGIALHKMIRLLTGSLAGEGYLNFMGNEFGHPEWIDFPREGNNYSYHYCRRQWSLADNKDLKYHYLQDFDKAMISLFKEHKVLKNSAINLWLKNDDKVLIYSKGNLIFAFNFNANTSFEDYFIPTMKDGKYKAIFSSDGAEFGGFNRVDLKYKYKTEINNNKCGFKCYLPNRTVTVFKKLG